jgi:hypothetical protein
VPTLIVITSSAMLYRDAATLAALALGAGTGAATAHQATDAGGAGPAPTAALRPKVKVSLSATAPITCYPRKNTRTASCGARTLANPSAAAAA